MLRQDIRKVEKFIECNVRLSIFIDNVAKILFYGSSDYLSSPSFNEMSIFSLLFTTLIFTAIIYYLFILYRHMSLKECQIKLLAFQYIKRS